MKKISKKELMTQINEARGAYVSGREDKNPWEETPEERVARGLPAEYTKTRVDFKESPFWFKKPSPDTPKDQLPAPDGVIVHDPENEDGYIVVVQIEGVAVTLINEDTLKAENPKFHTWATTPPNRLGFVNVNKKIARDIFGFGRINPKPSHMAYRKQISKEPFPGPDEPPKEQTERAKILRKFINPMLRSFAESVNDHLNSAGLPRLVIPEHQYQEQTENINKYTTIQNDKVIWSSQNTYFYPTVDKYIQNAKDLYRGRESQITPRETHLVRQDNPGRNWSPTRKSEKKDASYKADPLTPILKLDKSGYSAEDYDVEINEVFTIRGGITQFGDENRTAFKWIIEFKTQYGKKLREESRIQGGLVEDIYLTSEATTGPIDKLAGDDGSIATNREIVDAFKQALAEIQAQIMAIDPKTELRSRFAGVGRTEMTRQVDESIDIDSIVNKIISELKI